MDSKKLKAITFLLFWFELCFKFLFKIFKIKPTVIHCHDTLVLPIGVIYKMFSGCKLIYDAHELESQKFGQGKVLSFITYYLEKLSWKKIDVLISVSQSIIDWYNENLGFKKSILILNSPVINPNIGKSDNYFKQKYLIKYFQHILKQWM